VHNIGQLGHHFHRLIVLFFYYYLGPSKNLAMHK